MDDEVADIEGGRIKFRHKSRIHPKELQVGTTVPGSKKKKKNKVTIDQKQMAYYSERYAKKQREDREVMVERAKDLIDHPKKYDKVTSAGSAAYINNIAFDKTTGEVVEGKEKNLPTEFYIYQWNLRLSSPIISPPRNTKIADRNIILPDTQNNDG